jgi:hypothetical protein
VDFSKALERVLSNTSYERDSIGKYYEKTLHQVLKYYYEPDETRHELRVHGFIADIVLESGDVVEIQTSNLYKITKKLDILEKNGDGKLIMVYPISAVKRVCWIDPNTGEMSKKSKSPKTRTIHDATIELYNMRHNLLRKNFELRLVLLDMDEYRYLNGWSKDGKRGSVRCDRIPVALLDEVVFSKKEDYLRFMPDGLPELFSTKDYSLAAKINARLAFYILSVLCAVGCLTKEGRIGHCNAYRKTYG